MWSRYVFVWSVLCGCGGLATAVKISIYYTSLCSDTVNFFVNQFQPAYDVIGDDLDVDLVPFGKATAVNNSGTWNFTCQFGEDDCYRNKVHSCVIELAHHGSTEFVMCAFAGNASASANATLEPCAAHANLTWSAIEECLSSGQADELLAANGERTTSVEPEITFIPTIIYNDIFKESLQNLSLTNFLPTGHFLAEQHACQGCHFSGSGRVASTHLFVLGLSFLLIFGKMFVKQID